MSVTRGCLQCRCLGGRVAVVDGDRQSEGASQLPALAKKASGATPTEGSVVNISTATCTTTDNKIL